MAFVIIIRAKVVSTLLHGVVVTSGFSALYGRSISLTPIDGLFGWVAVFDVRVEQVESKDLVDADVEG